MTVAMNRQPGEGSTCAEARSTCPIEMTSRAPGPACKSFISDLSAEPVLAPCVVTRPNSRIATTEDKRGRSSSMTGGDRSRAAKAPHPRRCHKPPSRADYLYYEQLKAELTAKVTTCREYELAVREAAWLAGV